MKKIISSVVASIMTSALVFGCQSADNLNRLAPEAGSEFIHSNAVLSASNIDELIDGKATLGNVGSGVLVSTLSGGKIDEPNDLQKVSLVFAGAKNVLRNGGARKAFQKPIATRHDDRHGISEKEYTNQISVVKNAIKTGTLVSKKRILVNKIQKEGDTRTFKVRNDKNKLEVRTAVLVKLARTASFWIDQSEINDIDMNVLNSSVSYWDSAAYPLVTKMFGAAPTPPKDIDGDPRINLFIGKISDNKGLFGFFSPMDVISDKPESNGTDMLYLNSWMFKKGEASEHYAKSTLIHEFQHLVNFNVKVVQRAINNQQPVFESRWLNEGMSTYAEHLGGLGLPVGDMFAVTYLESYFKNPSAYPLVTDDAGLNYGAAYLFVLYLVEQYGPDAITKLTQSDKSGLENIELVTKVPFKKTFTDWATALLLSGSGKNPKFDFKSVNLHKTYAGNHKLDGINLANVINQYPVQASADLPNWTVTYIKLDNLSDQNINVSMKNSGNAALTTNLVKLN